MSKTFKKPSLSVLKSTALTVSDETENKQLYESFREKQLSKESHVVCVFDATGSMDNVWDSTKSILNQLIMRLAQMGNVNLKFIAYRDYMDTPMIESSSWSNDSKSLLNFLNKISCYGGGRNDGEAVEKGLLEAKKDGKATRFVLIGDEPPLSQDECIQYAKSLKPLNKPIFSFAVKHGNQYHPQTLKDFKNIAETSGGLFSKLNEVQDIMDIIAITIADDIGGKSAIQEYLKKYERDNKLSSGGREFGNKLLLGPNKK
ncbi:MAG: vWA domain-containing protein [Flagellimonas sp.]